MASADFLRAVEKPGSKRRKLVTACAAALVVAATVAFLLPGELTSRVARVLGLPDTERATSSGGLLDSQAAAGVVPAATKPPPGETRDGAAASEKESDQRDVAGAFTGASSAVVGDLPIGAAPEKQSVALRARPLAEWYGIELEELDYLDLPIVWKSDRRIIIYRPEYNLTHKTFDDGVRDKVVKTVEKVLEDQKGKGVIHCVNFEMARLLSTISDRMISHHEMSRKAAFARFLSEPGTVWISPPSTRGLDLPYDACEWVIWLKAPYLNLNDPLVNARLYGGGRLGKLWYAGDAVQNIIQGAGRGFRSEDELLHCLPV